MLSGGLMGEALTPVKLLAHRLSGGAKLSRAEIEALESLTGPPRRFAKGKPLVTQGATDDYVWLTSSGWAFRQKSLLDGRRQIVAFILPGELTEKGPQMPFGAPDTILAATEDFQAVPIGRARLLDLMKTYPRIQQGLYYEELTRHAVTREWMAVLGVRNAEERFAYLIYEVFARLNAMGLAAGNTFDVPISQTDLGDTLGMSTVHLNRTLQKLRAGGLVTWTGHSVHLPDPARLASFAEFSTGFQREAERFASAAVTAVSGTPDQSVSLPPRRH
ncbi:MAG: Crp/Fnr family transcriptional regulator [Verrucomicrobiaceae bacterium]|nr:MAG: Crp/Fnr family transcriptional regulator [Verrucomicrobiaceae bacterium]